MPHSTRWSRCSWWTRTAPATQLLTQSTCMATTSLSSQQDLSPPRTHWPGFRSKTCLGRFLGTSTIHRAKTQCRPVLDITPWSGSTLTTLAIGCFTVISVLTWLRGRWWFLVWETKTSGTSHLPFQQLATISTNSSQLIWGLQQSPLMCAHFPTTCNDLYWHFFTFTNRN